MFIRFAKKALPWLPCVCLVIASVITLACCGAREGAVTCLILLGSSLIPGVITLLSVIFKFRFPLLLNAILALHIFLACCLGHGMNFYNKYEAWDLVLHGHFGFLGSIGVYYVMLLANKGRFTPFDCVAIFLITMGIAALWEVYEFTGDILLNRDAQVQADSLAKYGNALFDTMTDIIITMAGVALFYIMILTDKFTGGRIRAAFTPKNVEK